MQIRTLVRSCVVKVDIKEANPKEGKAVGTRCIHC